MGLSGYNFNLEGDNGARVLAGRRGEAGRSRGQRPRGGGLMARWGSSGRSTTEEFLKERNAISQHKASHLLSPVPHGTDPEFCS